MELPKGFKLGKKKYNGVQLCSGPYYASVEQIFLECKYPNRPECHDTIALIPKQGHSIEEITDEQAGLIFHQAGWLVKGFNNKKYTRCPHCASLIKVEPKLPKSLVQVFKC